jgi:hypothetical protein
MHALHHDFYCLEINVSIMLQAGSTNQARSYVFA